MNGATNLPPKPMIPRPVPPQPSPLPSNIAWGQPDAIINTTVEFATPDYVQPTVDSRRDLMAGNELSPVWHYNGNTYFVWTDTGRRPQITKIFPGGTETFPIDPGPDYIQTTDGHGRFSLGIDTRGYIHVTGDMHNYTEGTTDPYIPRYQNQTILYWKSKLPESVSGGFSFVGGKGASTVIPGTGWTYGRFFTDNFGELYFSSRVKAINGGHVPGEIGLGVYRYNTSSLTWTALGALPDQIHSGSNWTYYKVLIWEVGGFASNDGNWFQGMLSTIKFDSENRMHLASNINSDPTLTGNNRVVYAVSSDGGMTWNKANGTKIPGLPIRAVDENPNVGDIVVEDRANPTFGLFTTVLTDKDGNQGVLQDKIWRIWNGVSWVIDSTLVASKVNNPAYKLSSDYGNMASNKSLLLTVSTEATILHVSGFGKPPYVYELPNYLSINAIDEYALRTTGVVYAIGITPDARKQVVLKITATPAPSK